MNDNYKYHETEIPSRPEQRGAGLMIHFGWHDTHLGHLLISCTDRGVCFIGLKPTDRPATYTEEKLRAFFPAAQRIRSDAATCKLARPLENRWNGKTPSFDPPLNLDVYGTPFQLRVWRALMNIPFGTLTSYADIARIIGAPRAARAVGGAVGTNPISILIPCHRIIQSSGRIENYGWGSDLKRHLLNLENAACKKSSLPQPTPSRSRRPAPPLPPCSRTKPLTSKGSRSNLASPNNP